MDNPLGIMEPRNPLDAAAAVIRQRILGMSAALGTGSPQPGLALRPPAVQGSRMLLVCALGTDPRETASTCRLLGIARTAFETARVQTEVLNLSVASPAGEPGLEGLADAPWHPGTAAHGVLILMPAHWRRASSALRLLINRSASCAVDGAASAEPGWSHQPYVGSRTYGLVMHGDLRCESQAREALCDWLDWLRLVAACEPAQLHHIHDGGESPGGHHPAPQAEMPLAWEVRCATAALVRALAEIEAGRLYAPKHLLMQAWPQ